MKTKPVFSVSKGSGRLSEHLGWTLPITQINCLFYGIFFKHHPRKNNYFLRFLHHFADIKLVIMHFDVSAFHPNLFLNAMLICSYIFRNYSLVLCNELKQLFFNNFPLPPYKRLHNLCIDSGLGKLGK